MEFKSALSEPDGSMKFGLILPGTDHQSFLTIGEESHGCKILRHETTPNPKENAKRPVLHTLIIQYKNKTYSITMGEKPVLYEETKETEPEVRGDG